TGQPKGVMVEQRSVVRLVRGADYVRLGLQDRILQMAPVSFDAATFEIWGALLNGGQVMLMEPGTPSLERIGRAIREQQITVAWLTAPLSHVMVEAERASLASLRELVAGGDVLSAEHVRRYVEGMAEGQALVNGYGPTEGTTFTCCYRMKGAGDWGENVPIGRPIANTRVYVLDAEMNPVPVGAVGEGYIGGAGVARG